MQRRSNNKSAKAKSSDRSISREIARQVRRFNDKIEREIRKNPSIGGILPDKLVLSEVKQAYTTKKDLRVLTNKVDRAFKRGAFKRVITKSGVDTTAYQLHELELGLQRINRARERVRKTVDQSPYKGTMGTIDANNLQPKKTNPNTVSARNWKKFVESIEKQAIPSYVDNGPDNYKAAYIKAAKRYLGGWQAHRVIEVVKQIPAYEFYTEGLNDPILFISYISDPLPAEEIANNVIERWAQRGYV